jgi:hypothetical protein
MAKKQSKSSSTTWCYDKHGKIRSVNQPLTIKGQTPPTQPTQTGALRGGIGFGGVMGKNIR